MSYLIQPDEGPPPAPLAPINDHVARAVGTLSAWASDEESSPGLHALVVSDAETFQSLENVCQQWLTYQTVWGAVGVYLDLWGEQVGLGRGTDNDADYRIKLRAAALRNKSSGTVPDLINMLTALLGDLCTRVIVTPVYPAALNFSLVCPAALSAAESAAVVSFVLDAVAAGVLVEGIAVVTPDTFTFDGYPIPPSAGYSVGAWATILYP